MEVATLTSERIARLLGQLINCTPCFVAASPPIVTPQGYVDDVSGYSFLGACSGDLDTWGGCSECGPTSDVKDTDGHGTHGMKGLDAPQRIEV